MKINISCDYCNKIFQKHNSDIKRTKEHFCCRECYYSKKNIDRKPKICSTCLRSLEKNYCHNCKDNEYSKKYYIKNREKILERSRLFSYKRKKTNRPPRKPNGSGYICPQGYKHLMKPGHPNCTSKQGKITEHVYLMSQHLGRPLMKGESVHHKNGIRLDNRIENLELWHKGQPSGQRVKDKLLFYKEFIEQYGGKVDLNSIGDEINKNEPTISCTQSDSSNSDK